MTDKSTKRRRTSHLLLRMLPEERRFLDAAAEKAEDELHQHQPTASLGLGPYLIGLGIRDAEKRLGQTLEEFTKPARGKKENGGR